MWAGIGALRAGGPDQRRRRRRCTPPIERSSQQDGRTYGIVLDYVGHGIGEDMHMPPQVPNYRHGGKSPATPVGTTICIEPMITLGAQANHVLADDEWTIVTDDGRAGRALGALGRRDPPPGCACSPRSTVARSDWLPWAHRSPRSTPPDAARSPTTRTRRPHTLAVCPISR
jgi:methionine aminopeptidase